MYPDPIPAIQIGSSSVVKKAHPPPRDLVTTTSTSESMTFEHNYASLSTCDVEVSAADDMDISFCDDGETPSLADCCTQVIGTTFSDASTQAHPTMKDAFTQTDCECDNWMRRKLFVDNLTANNKNCKFWTGIQTLSLLNFMFEWVLPCAQKVTLWMGKKRHNTQVTKQGKPRKDSFPCLKNTFLSS